MHGIRDEGEGGRGKGKKGVYLRDGQKAADAKWEEGEKEGRGDGCLV